MRVAIDGVGLSASYKGGATDFAQQLLKSITPDTEFNISLFLTSESQELFTSEIDTRIEIIIVKAEKPRVSRLLTLFATYVFRNVRMFEFAQELRWRNVRTLIDQNFDACLVPTTYTNFRLRKTPTMVTLHDIQEKTYPNFFSRREKLVRDIRVRATLRCATVIQSSSEFIAAEIRKHYKKTSENVIFKVIPEGFDSKTIPVNNAVKIRHNSHQKILRIVMPANFWKHKNHILLLDALSSCKHKDKIFVYFTGSKTEIASQIEEKVNELELENVHFLGYLPRADLIQLYQECNVVISCSLYESSSLPIIEGAALGCLPIASNIESHIQMSQIFDIILFPVNDPAFLAKLLDDLFIDFQLLYDNWYDANIMKVWNQSWDKLQLEYMSTLRELCSRLSVNN